MAHWLFKSEPGAWSWDDQMAAGQKGTEWDGVRNYQARNHMRAMKTGERGFFYHSGEEKSIVGIVEAIAEAHPDTTTEDERWQCVDLAAVEPLPKPVSLADIKAEPRLADMVLVTNSRLSVQPVSDEEWAIVRAMGGLKAPA
jgi:predicted RNA-binding protein with PUA-like domain